MRNYTLFIYILSTLLTLPGFGQSSLSTLAPSASATIYQRDSGRELALMCSGIASVALGLYLKQQERPFTRDDVAALDKSRVNALDRFTCDLWSPAANKWSDQLRNAVLLAPVAMLASERVRDDFETYGLMYLETMAINLGATLITKGIFRRTRPYFYNENVPIERKLGRKKARRSFISGHTSAAFASAVFLGTTYDRYFPDSRSASLVWATAAGGASAVGILRVLAGKHFPTDVIGGAVYGALAAYLVAQLHEKDLSIPDFSESRRPFRLGLRIQL